MMMKHVVSLLLWFSALSRSVAEDGGYSNYGNANSGYGNNGNNQAAAYSAYGGYQNGDQEEQQQQQQDYQNQGQQNYNNYAGSDDYIKYWTEYSILPKRCIVYNNVDVIVFSMYENYKNHCSDKPMGTYITAVPDFLQGYLDFVAQEMGDQGYDDYEAPAVAQQYAACQPYNIQNQQFYFQIGCADGTSQALAVNIYEDNTCTTRSIVDGYDDSNIDVSEIQIPFKECQNCVNWVTTDEEVDDNFYENRQTYAPLCSTAWMYKESCGHKCQHTGLESTDNSWSTPDRILLAILSTFGLIMLGLIVRRRQQMSNKDALLEQAAMSAAGLQQPHVVGVFILVVLVVAVFALLGLKNITWALLLIINTLLFGYLMKLTFDSGGASETVIGPDGTILRRDSDDSSVEDSSRNSGNAGTYMLPVLA